MTTIAALADALRPSPDELRINGGKIIEMTEAPRKRGWARMHEIRADKAEQRRQLVADLIEGLGRPATALDKVNARNVAFWDVEANYLESIGKDSGEARARLNQALRAFGIKGDKAKPAPKTMSPLEYARAKYSRPSVASDAASAPEHSWPNGGIALKVPSTMTG